MSTKIPHGVRIERVYLNDFARAVTKADIEEQTSKVINHMRYVTEDELLDWYKKPGNFSMDRQLAKLDLITIRSMKASVNSEDVHNLQCGWSLFQHCDFFYGWPWGDNVVNSFGKALEVHGVEEYVYSNSGDKPAEYTEEEWDLRGLAWDQVTSTCPRFQLLTVDFSSGFMSPIYNQIFVKLFQKEDNQ